MKPFKNIFLYATVIAGFSGLIYFISTFGDKLKIKGTPINPASGKGHWNDFIDSLTNNLHHPLSILLAQIITIILVARFFGWIFKRMGQPTVMGEIVAGIVLVPSLFGMYFPGVSAELFPKESLGNLQFLSQVGLILFMFIIGMELDLKMLKNKAKDVVIISHASIIIPFALGMALAYFLFESFAPEGIRFSSFALFMGIAMSITAFPVLARILQERAMHKTRLGAMVITCAAANDIAGWCLLASVIAIVKAGSFASSIYNILLAGAYILLMLKVVKPFLKKVGDSHASRQRLDKSVMAIFFVVLIISSMMTEVIGIHALFGAFMAGVIMPNNMNFKNIVIEKMEDVTIVLLLPLFFVFTGLRTQIGLLNDAHLWGVAGLIILVASIGKFCGSAFAARFVGQTWKDSLSIGALMNTRGLMELIVLNIGYDLGVITPVMFTMMVLMALVTTFMTGPVLNLINNVFKKEETTAENIVVQPKVSEPIS
ncbi:MAG: cation:proton antiporter [Ferruginibacter sp.]